ncbi:lipid IV(A) palmitoyltransferase PagP [Chitinibacter bivalviorum]|uniref:Lipid IV(A) palmitoyltransferase PagP n=1 Tax=Chitinibacter bivalviorum TaxID=2739434 RepID=A0A7H9BJA8_9NEIS|nr:lipid IV(A) palmitoyltransferase PagP [Chitinibacter bivalviorum]QLG88747.1 lipid IV(A) palmitoyltransferase PagP [Chitinibacter bivalviorum]
MLKKLWALIALLTVFSFPAKAVDCESWVWGLDTACSHIKGTWNEGTGGLYLSGYAWHNRATYDADKIDSYNEFAYGGGLGFHRPIGNRNEEMIYALAFADSHKNIEGHVGYAYMWYWDVAGPLRAGAGWTAGLFTRADIGNNIPLPFALPMFGIKYDKTNIFATYLPGGKNNGNVLFIFTRFDY